MGAVTKVSRENLLTASSLLLHFFFCTEQSQSSLTSKLLFGKLDRAASCNICLRGLSTKPVNILAECLLGNCSIRGEWSLMSSVSSSTTSPIRPHSWYHTHNSHWYIHLSPHQQWDHLPHRALFLLWSNFLTAQKSGIVTRVCLLFISTALI